ncbi:MAG: hypothetical protein M4579_001758 [Chaenotheca gracillima]|nr:MAG: hypothetical protein M4579_001758 [Chaenotheca gracillima]
MAVVRYALFSDYQKKVHHESTSEVSRQGFKRFLCSSPLRTEIREIEGREQKLGSYHQCYRVDGRLVAIGVIDLLPQCVSAVYFIYYEDMNKWNFGKVGALREAALAVEGGYKYYYMGYYIHSCVKMRYKGDYHPQRILDPVSYEWHPLDGGFRRRLDSHKYVSMTEDEHSDNGLSSSQQSQYPAHFEHDLDAEEHDEEDHRPSLFQVDMPGIPTIQETLKSINLNEMKIKVGRQITHTKNLVGWDEGAEFEDFNPLQDAIAEFAAAVGPKLAKEVVISF